MKALFFIQKNELSGLQEFFAEIHPWMVKIANKPSLEYLIDFTILNGCSKIRLIMDESDDAVRSYFGDGSRWGVEISYSGCSSSDNLDSILRKNSSFCGEDPLLIFNGLFFVHYHKELDYRSWHTLSPSGLMLHCATGSLLFGRSMENLRNLSNVSSQVDFSLTPIRSTRDIHDLTMQVLALEQDHYVLPGYGPEKDMLIGRNVEISPKAKLLPPLIIGDNAMILGESVIGPNAAIGSGAVIDKESEIRSSIVTDRTYLGAGLIIHEKIVNGNLLYSAPENSWQPLDDNLFFMTTEPQGIAITGRKLAGRLVALLLLLLAAFPWLILSIAGRFSGNLSTRPASFLKNRQGETTTFKTDVYRGPGFGARLFRALSFSRVRLLPRVLKGELALIGNRPLKASPENMQQLQNFDNYSPGVFGYSEADPDLVPGSLEAEITERFFAANNSSASDIRTMINVLARNFRTIRS